MWVGGGGWGVDAVDGERRAAGCRTEVADIEGREGDLRGDLGS